MLSKERRQLESFFRSNSKELPALSIQWFSFPNPIQSFIEKYGSEVFLAIPVGDDRLDPNPPVRLMNVSPEARKFYDDDFVHGFNAIIEKDGYIEAVRFANQRIREAEQRFSGNDLQGIKIKIYHERASMQGWLVEQGPFKELPHGTQLRSLCCLSAATDYMRADIQYGYVSDRGRQIAECFGYSEMELLQRRAVDKIFGQGTEIVYQDTLTSTRRYSIPGVREIAQMQRAIMSKLQPLM